MKNRRLYVVGVGPGDPELITLKGKKVIEGSQCIFYPVKKEGENSVAFNIIKNICDLEGKKFVPLVFPMTKDENVLKKHWRKSVNIILNSTFNVSSFITLGDPSIYCTYFYLHEKLRSSVEVFFVPGVSSFSACSLAYGFPLVIKDESMVVISASYLDDFKWVLKDFDTVIFMKLPKSRDKLFLIREKLLISGFKKIVFATKCSMEEEVITDEIPDKIEYISMLMAFKRDGLPSFTL